MFHFTRILDTQECNKNLVSANQKFKEKTNWVVLISTRILKSSQLCGVCIIVNCDGIIENHF